MRRSPALAPLSRDHHQALAIALLLRRATADTVADGVARFRDYFAEHGDRHFELEERHLGSALDSGEWATLIGRMRSEHSELRALAAALAGEPTPERAHELGRRLDAHVRFEERELFPHLEERLAPEALAALGALIDPHP